MKILNAVRAWLGNICMRYTINDQLAKKTITLRTQFPNRLISSKPQEQSSNITYDNTAQISNIIYIHRTASAF